MTAHVTLGVTTAQRVAACVMRDREQRFAVDTESQALEGTIGCVERALSEASSTLDMVELLCVCVGPGSFTGLRIGIAFMKALAQARNLPLIGVSSYDIVERSLRSLPSAAVVEGKRGYWYVRLRNNESDEPELLHGESTQLQSVVDGAASWGRLSDLDARECAARTALIGHRLYAQGADADWRRLAIDYGQQPNAVTNWDLRGSGAERVDAANASNFPRT